MNSSREACFIRTKTSFFEGHTFEGPAQPEELCRIIYGDYEKLPPKNKRDNHHVDVVVYD